VFPSTAFEPGGLETGTGRPLELWKLGEDRRTTKALEKGLYEDTCTDEVRIGDGGRARELGGMLRH
jgi:hypothetical protein